MASAGDFPLPLVSVGVAAAIEGGGGAVGLGGIGVLVTVGDGTGVGVSVGTAVNTAFTLASIVASRLGVAKGTGVYVGYGVGLLTGSVPPPQPASNTAAVERRSSRIILSFTKPSYPKCLLNGSTEATACLQYASDPLLCRRSLRHWFGPEEQSFIYHNARPATVPEVVYDLL